MLIYQGESNVLQCFGYKKHNLVTPDDLADVMKVTIQTELRDVESA